MQLLDRATSQGNHSSSLSELSDDSGKSWGPVFPNQVQLSHFTLPAIRVDEWDGLCFSSLDHKVSFPVDLARWFAPCRCIIARLSAGQRHSASATAPPTLATGQASPTRESSCLPLPRDRSNREFACRSPAPNSVPLTHSLPHGSSSLTLSLRRHPFTLFGLPFLSLVVLSSFALSGFTQTRYDYRDQKVTAVSKEDELGMRKDRRKIDVREEYWVRSSSWWSYCHSLDFVLAAFRELKTD